MIAAIAIGAFTLCIAAAIYTNERRWSDFGDGYGEPYQPVRTCWGILDGQEIVWTERPDREEADGR